LTKRILSPLQNASITKIYCHQLFTEEFICSRTDTCQNVDTMSHLHGLGGMAAHFLASPQGQQTIRNYLASEEGQATFDAFLATPHGQQMAFLLLSKALDGLDLPDETKEVIRKAMAAKDHKEHPR
jgi:hypothetical protein